MSTLKDNVCLLRLQVERVEMEIKKSEEKGAREYQWRRDLGKERKGWKSLKERKEKKTKK
jgi:hypothetical protein